MSDIRKFPAQLIFCQFESSYDGNESIVKDVRAKVDVAFAEFTAALDQAKREGREEALKEKQYVPKLSSCGHYDCDEADCHGQ